MRLISQDGTIDVPYEHGSLCIGFIKGEEHIIDTISYYNYSSQKGTKLAEYSSKAKALKVMEMVREQYMKLGMIKILASGTCEYMDRSLPKKEKMDIYADYCKKHIFQFPKDEEMED